VLQCAVLQQSSPLRTQCGGQLQTSCQRTGLSFTLTATTVHQQQDLDSVEDCWSSPSAELQYIAGLHADETVLSLAEELGMPLSAEPVEGAAASGRVTVLEYLVEERHCSLPRDVESSASYSGNIDVLKYLVKRGCEFRCAAFTWIT
jgi:hypothetical protein